MTKSFEPRVHSQESLAAAIRLSANPYTLSPMATTRAI